MTVAVLFFMSFMNEGLAQGSMLDKGTVKGEVVAIDNAHNMRTMTLRSDQIGQFPNNELNLFLNHDTTFKVCNANEPFKDMSVDRTATVTYHEVGGVAVANSISEHC
jgi:hypothetical protein